MSHRRECMKKMDRLKSQSEAIEKRVLQIFENLKRERNNFEVRYKEVKAELGE